MKSKVSQNITPLPLSLLLTYDTLCFGLVQRFCVQVDFMLIFVSGNHKHGTGHNYRVPDQEPRNGHSTRRSGEATKAFYNHHIEFMV